MSTYFLLKRLPDLVPPGPRIWYTSYWATDLHCFLASSSKSFTSSESDIFIYSSWWWLTWKFSISAALKWVEIKSYSASRSRWSPASACNATYRAVAWLLIFSSSRSCAFLLRNISYSAFKFWNSYIRFYSKVSSSSLLTSPSSSWLHNKQSDYTCSAATRFSWNFVLLCVVTILDFLFAIV